MRKLKRIIRQIRSSIIIIGTILTILGSITFSLFILEESIQMVTFGTWAAQDAGDWEHVKRGADIIRGLNTTSKWINNTIGMLHPLAYVSYRGFCTSADYYEHALRMKIFAHRPDLFVGEVVTIDINPTGTSKLPSGQIKLDTPKFTVLINAWPDERRPIRITGKVISINGRITIIKQ